MDLILSYLNSMVFYNILFLPIYLIDRRTHIKKNKKKNISINYLYEAILLAFVMYSIAMASQTIIPEYEVYIDINNQIKIDIDVGTETSRINLIPFNTLNRYLFMESRTLDNWNVVSLINLVGNSFLFSPIGIVLPLLYKKFDSFKIIFLTGLMTTLSIEFIQIFIKRSVDIDDIILNTIGVIIGYILYKIFKKFKFFRKFIYKVRK